MGYDIGPRIGITGEKEFNNQLNSINNKLKELGSELKATTSEFGKNTNGQAALISKNKLLVTQLDTQREKLKLLNDQYDKEKIKLGDLKDAVEKATQTYGKNSIEVNKAQVAYNKQETVMSKLKVSINETKGYVNKLTNEIDQNKSALNEMEAGTRDAETGLSKLADSAKDAADGIEKTGEQLEQVNKKLDAGLLMQASEQLDSLGNGIQGIGQKAYQSFSDLNNATVKASQYFGETEEQAKETAKAVQDVFETGLADSLDSVSEAIIIVKRNIQGLDSETLKNITEQAIILDNTFGADIDETIRGVKALMVSFGIDAQEAMDLIVKGTQNGLDKTHELGDNLAEYAPLWSQAGFSASETFAIMDRGLSSGAYNLDKVNDFVKEFAVSMNDGRIKDNLDSFSEGTRNLFHEYEKGKATSADVFYSVINDLNTTMDQQEALTLASNTWSALGEDNALSVIQSLNMVSDEYNNVSGAAKQMNDSTTTEMQKLEGNTRKMADALVPLGEQIAKIGNIILPPLADGVKALSTIFAEMPEPIQILVVVLGGLIVLLTSLAPVITAVMAVIGTMGTVAMLPMLGWIVGIAAAITAIIVVFQNWGAITDWFGEKFGQFGKWLDEEWTKLEDMFGKGLDNVCKWFQELPENIKIFLAEAFNNMLSWGAMMTGLAGDIGEDTVSGIIDFVMDLPDELYKFGRKAIVKLASGIAEMMGLPGDKVGDMVGTILDVVTFLPREMGKVGLNLVKGLWEGIRSAKDWILDKIGGWCDSVVKDIKNFFGIKSPSKVMSDEVGKYIAMGVGDGISKNKKSAISPFKSMLKELTWDSDFSMNSNIHESATRIYQTADTPVQVNMYMDGQKVASTVTRIQSRTQINKMVMKGA